MTVSDLPAVNASLNFTSAVLLVLGYCFIRQRKVTAHKRAMLSACVTSTLFLTSYLIYHFQVGSVSFQGQGWIRPVYFSILIPHVILAGAIIPLVILTLIRAFKGQFERHARLARWTLPLWLYVSVTGVLIYFMLYQLDFG